MELGNLQQFVLLLVLTGLIVGVGVLVLDKFSVSAQNTSGSTFEQVAYTTESPNPTLANTDHPTISSAINSTSGDDIYADGGLTTSTAGVLTFTGAGNVTTWNVTYTYKVDSAATDSLQAGRDAVGGIASSWMSLIVTIGILSLILGLVIAGFSYAGSRR